MNFLNWHSALLIGLYVSPFISALLYTLQAENKRHGQILLLWVVSSILTSVPTALGFAGFFNQYPEFRYLPIYALTFSGPLLIAYIFSMTRGKLPKWLLVTFTIPLLEMTYRLVLFFLPEITKQSWLLNWHQPIFDDFFTALGALLMLIAGFVVIFESKSYKRFLRNQSSQLQDYFAFAVSIAAVVIVILSLFWVYIEVYELAGGILSHKQEYPFYVGLLLLAYMLSQISIFSDRYQLPRQDLILPLPEHENKSLDKMESENILDQLLEKELYLQPRLNLSKTADLLHVTKSQITAEIQLAKFNNFNHFINFHRIEFAKKLLTNSNKDILEIGFDSGFNSKASFNRAFKDLVSFSPTDYRSKHS